LGQLFTPLSPRREPSSTAQSARVARVSGRAASWRFSRTWYQRGRCPPYRSPSCPAARAAKRAEPPRHVRAGPIERVDPHYEESLRREPSGARRGRRGLRPGGSGVLLGELRRRAGQPAHRRHRWEDPRGLGPPFGELHTCSARRGLGRRRSLLRECCSNRSGNPSAERTPVRAGGRHAVGPVAVGRPPLRAEIPRP
jgi:hypothetical protein